MSDRVFELENEYGLIIIVSFLMLSLRIGANHPFTCHNCRLTFPLPSQSESHYLAENNKHGHSAIQHLSGQREIIGKRSRGTLPSFLSLGEDGRR